MVQIAPIQGDEYQRVRVVSIASVLHPLKSAVGLKDQFRGVAFSNIAALAIAERVCGVVSLAMATT